MIFYEQDHDLVLKVIGDDVEEVRDTLIESLGLDLIDSDENPFENCMVDSDCNSVLIQHNQISEDLMTAIIDLGYNVIIIA